MKVIPKESYEAEQFNPKNGIPSCVVDLLRVPAHSLLISKGYEWGVSFPDDVTRGIHIGDWIITCRGSVFIYSNERFKQIFKEATK